jgi:choline-phosphate cytidylyltransferase
MRGTLRRCAYSDVSLNRRYCSVVLHLRQAKLSFPSVHLLVGVFPDPPSSLGPPLVERAELLRHVRWVDAVLPSAPPTPTPAWLAEHSIDVVALPEGASVDPAFDPARFAAYERLRELGPFPCAVPAIRSAADGSGHR